MNPIEKLMNEHQNILRGLDLLDQATIRLEKGEHVSSHFFALAVDFIRNYADKYHHAKEENILFARMGEVGFSPEMGPLAVMLYEHDQGRGYVNGLDDATKKYAAGERAAAREIIQNARAYANLLRLHIHKEDTILYPMAENALGEMGIELMRPEFDKVEEEQSGVESKYIRLLESVESEAIPTKT